MRAHRLIATGLTTALLTNCAPAEQAPTGGGVPPVRQIALHGLPEGPPHADAATPILSTPPDQSDPVQVAIDALAGSFTVQGLDVLDVGTTVLAATPDEVTVRVAITHASDSGVDDTSVYDVTVALQVAGSWDVVAVREVA